MPSFLVVAVFHPTVTILFFFLCFFLCSTAPPGLEVVPNYSGLVPKQVNPLCVLRSLRCVHVTEGFSFYIGLLSTVTGARSVSLLLPLLFFLFLLPFVVLFFSFLLSRIFRRLFLAAASAANASLRHRSPRCELSSRERYK